MGESFTISKAAPAVMRASSPSKSVRGSAPECRYIMLFFFSSRQE
jgi:hypothetical protein